MTTTSSAFATFFMDLNVIPKSSGDELVLSQWETIKSNSGEPVVWTGPRVLSRDSPVLSHQVSVQSNVGPIILNDIIYGGTYGRQFALLERSCPPPQFDQWTGTIWPDAALVQKNDNSVVVTYVT